MAPEEPRKHPRLPSGFSTRGHTHVSTPEHKCAHTHQHTRATDAYRNISGSPQASCHLARLPEALVVGHKTSLHIQVPEPRIPWLPAVSCPFGFCLVVDPPSPTLSTFSTPIHQPWSVFTSRQVKLTFLAIFPATLYLPLYPILLPTTQSPTLDEATTSSLNSTG